MVQLFLADKPISIHAPRTGSDSVMVAIQMLCVLFQSTLPARGATDKMIAASSALMHFNPRSPHGERRVLSALPT